MYVPPRTFIHYARLGEVIKCMEWYTLVMHYCVSAMVKWRYSKKLIIIIIIIIITTRTCSREHGKFCYVHLPLRCIHITHNARDWRRKHRLSLYRTCSTVSLVYNCVFFEPSAGNRLHAGFVRLCLVHEP